MHRSSDIALQQAKDTINRLHKKKEDTLTYGDKYGEVTDYCSSQSFED
ncbi:hypothetical protein OROGR_018380 [Orobanche gracilis]